MAWSLAAEHVPVAQFDQNFRIALALRLGSAILAHEKTFHLSARALYCSSESVASFVLCLAVRASESAMHGKAATGRANHRKRRFMDGPSFGVGGNPQ